MSLLTYMSNDLRIDEKYISKCSKHNNLYAKYMIAKKDGGKRIILHPSKELKVMQYWLCKNIFVKFPISQYSSAYQKGCSIKKNALVHKSSKYILHTDITNFFESIKRSSMKDFFKRNNTMIKKLNLTKDDINLILDLILYNGDYLVVGSVASPLVSNCFMYDFDIEISRLIEPMDMKYTRYADDIIISSSKYIDKKILSDIDLLLENYNLKRNVKKTYFMNKKMKRQITGIVIDNNNDSLSLGTKKHLELKRSIYNYLIKGVGNIDQIKGNLSYLKDINYDKYLALENTYIKYDKNNAIFNCF